MYFILHTFVKGTADCHRGPRPPPMMYYYDRWTCHTSRRIADSDVVMLLGIVKILPTLDSLNHMIKVQAAPPFMMISLNVKYDGETYRMVQRLKVYMRTHSFMKNLHISGISPRHLA